MWLSRAEYIRLVSADQQLITERRTHATQIRELLRRIRVAERREANAVAAAESERTENRTAERWWADALLRAKQSLPLSAKVEQPAAGAPFVAPRAPAYDQGEMEAVIAAGAEYGVSPAEAKRIFLESQGISP